MSYEETQLDIEVIEALKKMRHAILFFLVSWVPGTIGSIIVFSSFPMFMYGVSNLPAVFGVGIALLVIGSIIWFIGLFAKFIPGVSDLASASPEFSTASSLIKIGHVLGLILLIIGSILFIIVIIGAMSIMFIGISILVGIGSILYILYIFIVGVIFILIGSIGIIILCFKLNDKYRRNTLYLIAGILFIIGILIPVLDLVAWILLYVALGNTIRELQTL